MSVTREPTDIRDDAGLAADLVTEAGRLAADMRREGLRAQHKKSISDVVTAADRAAEALIADHLAAWRPDDGVLGEEGAFREGTSGRRWIIDPVDGTYNFVQGLTWWCSAVALVDGDELLFGAVYHPQEDALYVGGPNLSSTRNGARILPLADRPLAEVCAATYLNPARIDSDVAAAFGRAASGAAALRMLGSGTMDAMAIAQGQLGVYFQHSVPEWDWLPGLAVIEGVGGIGRQVEAGGVTWSVAGSPRAVDEVCIRLEDR
ncbi:MAG: inositol monophosphatase family protein [Marmoricola sp.]